MTKQTSKPTSLNVDKRSRRDFIKTSTAGAVGAAVVSGMTVPRVHAAGSDTLKIGLVGCGGRGSGAAKDAMHGDSNCKLWALGDVFEDHLASKKNALKEAGGDKYAVTDDRCFVGFDAYKHVIDCVDVVLLATPPGFRPIQFKYAVEQGKHCFVEKPVAVDGPGCKSILESCELAKKKNLAVVSGLCYRYHRAMRETIRRVLDGDIGEIVSLQTDYNTRRPRVLTPREPGWSDMEFQIRNWYFYAWLSGDHNVEQHIHSLDKMAWVMGDEYPVRAYGSGGRQAIAPEEPGHIFDHHAVCYEYANGTRCYSYCRQQNGSFSDTKDWIYGSEGSARLLPDYTITGKNAWRMGRREQRGINMYQQEHSEMFASIRAGKPINNGEYMTKSSLMAIMGRMATYSGQLVTWQQAMDSKEDLSPPEYNWISLPEPPVAVPGLSKLV